MDTTHERSVRGKDEWLTPPYIMEALGAFDLDPCAPAERPWPTAKEHYTIFDNGLNKPWHGRVWLNPPYSKKLEHWVARLAAHGEGTALLFARTDTKLFSKYVFRAATAVLFIEGRLSFYNKNGTIAAGNAGAPSCLVAYGEGDADLLLKTNTTRKIQGNYVLL